MTPCLADEGDTVTKKQIVKDLSQRYGVDQAVTRKIVQGVLDAVVASLAEDGRIELRNFGVFEIRKRASRVARNPRTNEPIRLPPRKVVVFQPGKRLQDLTEETEQTQGQPERQQQLEGQTTPQQHQMPV
jgi:nucleoid DNA-binding protein